MIAELKVIEALVSKLALEHKIYWIVDCRGAWVIYDHPPTVTEINGLINDLGAVRDGFVPKITT